MKIWIDSARPTLDILIRPNAHEFYVHHWDVEGYYLEDEKGCECAKLPFSIQVNWNTLMIHKNTMTELVVIEVQKKYLTAV
jgi:hypothetical protein